MPNQFDEQDSLDRAVTRTGEGPRTDPLRPRTASDTGASLGEQETGAESLSSLSDLADLGDDGDEPQEIVDLESRYEILDVLGRGGMGEVVRAVDRRLKRQVAIKRMRAELGASRQAMRRFLTEAVSVAALNHFNVVQIHDYGHTADGPFLVMELVEGPTLAELLKNGPLPLEEAVELACQLCDGLHAAHDRGIIHRDIKPANVLITGTGTPKLTDFGLAKEAGDTGHTQAGAVLGTLDYMSPEQKADSSRAAARSDQWSLAATFYQMVTGEPPRIIDTDRIPEPVRDVVRRALKTNPEERFESVREFGEALRDAVNPSGEPELDRSMLQEGQCPGCGTVNDLARQFCRGCGAGLEETCPECGAGEKVWERFCGKCGTDIPAVLEAQIESARELPGEVQSLRSDFRHAEALEKIAPLLGLSHPALEEHREWAEKTRNQLAGELAELESQRAQLLQAGREQMEQGSFSEASKYLAQIPAAMQNGECRQLDSRLADLADEARQLAGEIREATRSRNFPGLDTKLERYFQLKPQDEKARRLLEKVRERLRRTAPKLSAGQAEGAVPSPGPPATVPENEVPARSSARTAVIATGCGMALLLMFVWRFLAGGSSSDAPPPLFDSVTAARTDVEAKAAQQAKPTPEVAGANTASPVPERNGRPEETHQPAAKNALPVPVFSVTFDDDVVSQNQLSSSGVSLVDGIEGKAAKYEGGKFLQLSCQLPAGQAPRTLSAWIRNAGESEARNSHVISCGKDELGKNAWGICHVRGRWCMYGGGAQPSTDAAVDSEWHHHCLTFDGASLLYWLDGKVVANISRTLDTTDGPITLGTYTTGSTYYAFTGVIDEVNVYDVALTEQQIKQLGVPSVNRISEAEKSSAIPVPVLYLPFDSSVPIIPPDLVFLRKGGRYAAG